MREIVRALIWLGVIAGALGALLYLFVVDTWRVPLDPSLATAAAPQLAAADLLLVRRSGPPKHGELARCLSPADGSYVVGRVYGEPGQHVEVKDDVVTTNGQAPPAGHHAACPAVTLPHPVTQNLVKLSCGVADTGASSFQYLTGERPSASRSATDVGPGKLYLVSDNRHLHQDSRDFGVVDAASCQHVVYRLWGEKYADDGRRFTLLW